MIRPKIMVIDDDHSITTMLDFLLRSRGYDVVIAHDARTAIGLACRHLPRLILLDFGLPDMNGLELLERIRNYEDLAETPVIMITAYGERQLVAKALQFEVVDFVVKPFEVEILAERVANWVPISGNWDFRK